MKILFTGASSFTGFWLVKALAAAGHEVVCPITRPLASYTDVRRQRLELLQPCCRLVSGASFGSDVFLQLARGESFDQLCHHAADVTNYKSPDFNALAALANNTHNLPAVLSTLRTSGLKSVVLTGTFFEAGEGRGTQPLVTFSPYSHSKTLTCERFQEVCCTQSLPLGKFVLPNPVGPFEEPRFTAYLMNNWKAGRSAEVKTPDYVRDNIHVDLLAAVYAQFTARVALQNTGFIKMNPSGYVESQGEFARRVAREIKTRLGWNCELILARQESFTEPLERTNTEHVAALVPGWNEPKAWDAFAEYYVK